MNDWRTRRWRYFLQRYEESPKLRKRLREAKTSRIVANRELWEITVWLNTYGIPTELTEAVKLYLSNDSLAEQEYLSLIESPLRLLKSNDIAKAAKDLAKYKEFVDDFQTT